MPDHIVIRQPATPATRLLLLFHGVGSSARDLAPVGEALAQHLGAGTCIVSINAPDASDFGQGWQWFSVQGVTETNRPQRVAHTLPRFVQTVQHWQRTTGVNAAHTALLGFSQGAIMALESTQQTEPLAGQVVAIAGRFARPPQHTPTASVHLVHGEADAVMPLRCATDALAQLQALGAQVTLDRIPGLGHGIDARALGAALKYLKDEAAV